MKATQLGLYDVTLQEVKNTGDVTTEYVAIYVNDDCDIGDYLLTDTTYDGHGHPSNKHRHVYFFPSHQVKKGDVVMLYSHQGVDSVSTIAGLSSKAHTFYWNLKETVWNKTGDAAYLLKAPRYLRQQKRVPAAA